MITSIDRIHGIGKYDSYDGPVSISKNQIFFGFNGSGKSTLSDIFYSLSDEKHCQKLMERKTLQREDGSFADNPEVILGADDGNLHFQEGRWNCSRNIYVFNDQYIEDYVTLMTDHDVDREQLVLGKEGNRLYREQKGYLQQMETLLENISNVILNNRETTGKLGLGKSRITINTKNRDKKVNEVASLRLLTASQQKDAEKQLRDKIAFDANAGTIDAWIRALETNQRFLETTAIDDLKSVRKTLLLTPEVTNREIAEHISNYMIHTDINWLVNGMNNRLDSSHCPFCGQELKGKSIEKLSRQLDRFIKGRQKQKADKITALMKKAAPYFDEELLENLFQKLHGIYAENQAKNILHKSTTDILEKMQLDTELEPGCFHGIIRKIEQKRNNPYTKINPEEEDNENLLLLCRVIRQLNRLRKALGEEKNKIQRKIEKTKEYEKTSALYEASFGPNADHFRQMVEDARKIQKLNEKVKDCQKQIDHLAETQRINGINAILEELNVNYRVHTEQNRFYVKIDGYVPAEYDKDNRILCSEGEKRMLAFAYFMQEVTGDRTAKIVVIDDPISSLDMSRKSVVAFLMVQLMEAADDQIIILSHDISFVEKIKGLENSKIEPPTWLEIRKKKNMPFVPLNITDYLVTDKEVYEQIIQCGVEGTQPEDRILALMAMRPYVYVTIKPEAADPVYQQIEASSTYFHHSLYASSKRVFFDGTKYDCAGLRAYCNAVNRAAGSSFDSTQLIPAGFTWQGLDYPAAWNLYSRIPDDTMFNLRRKAIAFRILLETTLFMLLTKARFDPEHIGKFYNNAVKGQTGEKKEMCREIKKLYDLSKKYHHGAEDGSTLGLSALNPDEMLYFDQSITKIHDWIVNHPSECNPNAATTSR